MSIMILLVLGLCVLGFYIHVGIIFNRVVQLAQQRSDLRTSAWLLLVNLAEPFIMGVWLLIQLIYFDFESLIGSVGEPLAATSSFFTYYWPMALWLIGIPVIALLFIPQAQVRATAIRSLWTGAMRLVMVWLCFNFIMVGATILIAIGLSIWSLRLINSYYKSLMAQSSLAVVFDQHGLAIQAIVPSIE